MTSLPPLTLGGFDLRTTKPIEQLRRLLDACHYKRLYSEITGNSEDPWPGFRSYESPSGFDSRQRLVWDLFYDGHSIPADEFARAFSVDDMESFIGIGLLIHSKEGCLYSQIVVLVYFDNYIVLDQPQQYANGSWGPGSVYLDTVSLDAARELVPREPVDAVLEIGPGSGLLLIEASRYSRFAMGIDIDSFAAMISRLNIILNGRNSNTFICVGDIAAPLKVSPIFQTILFHPPYRVVPPDVAYPYALARVGRGIDGLDILRRFLTEAVNHLRPRGKILFGCEFPASNQYVPFYSELESLALRFGWQVKVRVRSKISVVQQAAITAEKCHLLNPGRSLEELSELILTHYKVLGFSQLVSCWVTITSTEHPKVSIE